jgi:TIR domain
VTVYYGADTWDRRPKKKCTFMMPDSDEELLARVATSLDALGPFPSDAKRDEKWRTTDQLANELGLFGRDAVARLNKVLRDHEAEGLERMKNGQEAERVIRRAKYPDRTTALPLWGRTRHHGQPWSGYSPERSDPAEDLPSSLAVPEDAPHVFLSYAGDDASTALRLAESLAVIRVGVWRFETDIEQRGDIAECVHSAIAESDALLGLLTRTSIASLWVLTELHTSLKMQKTVALVVDADDPLLLQLLESARFSYPDGDFDLSAEYDRDIVRQLSHDFRQRNSQTRSDRYEKQLGDFIATLPLYLGDLSSDGHRIWRPALGFPKLPERWSGFIELCPLDDLPQRLAK